MIITDKTYSLAKILLKPNILQELNPTREHFSKRLFQARETVRCAFSIFRFKWQILDNPIETNAEFADKINKAICILHNRLINKHGAEHNLRDNKFGADETVSNKLYFYGKVNRF